MTETPTTILAVNPGSTTTRIALFGPADESERAATGAGVTLLASEEVQHPRDELAAFDTVMDQAEWRLGHIHASLDKHRDLLPPAVVVGRGGLLAPLAGGVYRVDQRMLDDLAGAGYGEHPCNLGALLARELTLEFGVAAVPPLVADPVVTDEMDERARVTGLPGVTRRSVFHALNQRASARAAAARLGLRYAESRFLVAHMGGGISVGAHRLGKVVDVNNALDGDGPFAPERTGGLPLDGVLDVLESGRMTIPELRRTIRSSGGLVAHLGTHDLREVEARMDKGDAKAALIFQALVYNVAKSLCALVPAMAEPGSDAQAPLPNAIVLTGGMANSQRLTTAIGNLTAHVAPLAVITGMEEMTALAEAARLALEGEVEIMTYQG